MTSNIELPEFSLLETMLWTPEEGYLLLDYHLKRLSESAACFNFSLNFGLVQDVLFSNIDSRPKIPHRIRLLAEKNGELFLEEIPYPDYTTLDPVRIRLADSPINSKNPFLYHKTTLRKIYEDARTVCSDCDDVLLWNERGEVTETSIANFILERDGELITPPIHSGLLPGTMRASLIDRGEIREEIIPVEEVKNNDKMYLINSVQGKREALLIT